MTELNINTLELSVSDLKQITNQFNSFIEQNKKCYFTTIGDFGYEIKETYGITHKVKE